MPPIPRRLFLRGAASAACVAAAGAKADTWPSRPIRIVNNFAAGGATDVLARAVAERLSTKLGQPFFVETRSGAGGLVGVQSVIATEPDGYNFVITSPQHLVTGPLIGAKMGYDPKSGLTNIAYLAGSPGVILVNPKKDIRTLSDLIARGRTRVLSFSASGAGSNGHLLVEALAAQSGIKVELIPYKGASQGLADLMGGHIDFSSQSLSSASGYIRGNTLLPIVHSGTERFPGFDDIPTFTELGFVELELTSWFGLAGPPGLPVAIAERLNQAIRDVLAPSEAKAKLAQDGMVSIPMTRSDYAAFLEGEEHKWGPLIRGLNIKADAN